MVKLESKAIDIPAGGPPTNEIATCCRCRGAVSVYPHAHYLATVEGTATCLTAGCALSIPRWNIRWQDQYRYRAPVPLPRGTTLRMRFVYDNSAANPSNRFRPPRRVQWGPLSTDEMGALWLEVVPRRAGDAAVLARDYTARALAAETASAELALRSRPRMPW